MKMLLMMMMMTLELKMIEVPCDMTSNVDGTDFHCISSLYPSDALCRRKDHWCIGYFDYWNNLTDLVLCDWLIFSLSMDREKRMRINLQKRKLYSLRCWMKRKYKLKELGEHFCFDKMANHLNLCIFGQNKLPFECYC